MNSQMARPSGFHCQYEQEIKNLEHEIERVEVDVGRFGSRFKRVCTFGIQLPTFAIYGASEAKSLPIHN